MRTTIRLDDALLREAAVIDLVNVLDQYANPVPNATVSWAAAPGTFAFSASTMDANGITSDSLVLGVTARADAITLFTPGANQMVTAAVNATAN